MFLQGIPKAYNGFVHTSVAYLDIGTVDFSLTAENGTDNREGTFEDVFIVRDSFSDVLIPFMSLAYAQLDVIDLRGFSGDLMGYIEESAPDVVMVVYNPGAYEPKNFGMFDFLNAS